MKRPGRYFSILADLLYPRTCSVCSRTLQQHEQHLCLYCLRNIPRTQHHLDSGDNEMEQLFRGKIPIEKAAAFFYFTSDSDYRTLIHRIKYRDEKECARYLGTLYAQEIGTAFFAGIDRLVPVPLHPRQRRQRGYNQSECIADGIAAVTGLPVSADLLQRSRYTPTQTAKESARRWENVQDAFALQGNPAEVGGQHLLLIDDVVTTGATLQACALPLLGIKNVKISLLTLAITR